MMERPSRRAVLAALPRAALAAFLIAVGLARAARVRRSLGLAPPERIIRPPGALPKGQFKAACVRCTRCVDVCPTKAIEKVGMEGWPEEYGTPRLVTKCLFWDGCTQCVDACPTDALSPFDPDKVRLATAEVVESTCIVHKQEKQCFVCQEFCPFDAVKTVLAPGNEPPFDKVPQISATECMGCFFCHEVCPTDPKSIKMNPVMP